MTNIPRLTKLQRVRFAKYLFHHRVYASIRQARKAIDSDFKCRKIVLEIVHIFDLQGINTNDIQDILDLYVIEDEAKETHKKVEQPNCGSYFITEHPNCTHKKELPPTAQNNTVVNKTHKKVRGKQKKPTMIHQRVRLPADMLQRLGELDGTISGNIRAALGEFLDKRGL